MTQKLFSFRLVSASLPQSNCHPSESRDRLTRTSSTRVLLLSIIAFLFFLTNCETTKPGDRTVVQMEQNFVNPPLKLKSRPLWFWNAPLSIAQTRKVLQESKEAGYYGLGILPSYGMTPEYMTPEFLAQYKAAVEIADSLGMKICLYDEYYFPSGMAGGNLVKQYPGAVSKRLDMEITLVAGPVSIEQPMPAGIFLGAVAMEESSFKRINLSNRVSNGRLSADLPAGDWRVMVYTLNPDNSSERNHVDYLSPEAVQRFIELTYEKYYQTFPEHFGTTIDFAFYDEPCLRWVEGGRTWTGDFNKKFMERYGIDPIELYPSLWFDIGPETESARNQLLGFRAELYAQGFPKVINDWCRAHKIQLTGHVDQEEILNPVATCGDLIKAFKYQDIPAVDEIFHYGRSTAIYKVISSSANNYDRPVVATECYGAMGRMSEKILYQEAMDQFAKGINLMEPHAVWYTDVVDIQPDLSPTSKKFGTALPAFNQYIGRLQNLLQGGQHVADIGILYPIASLQGSYHFGPGDPGVGGVIPAEADYLDIGEMLALDIHRDFTFVHPEILDEKCLVGKGKMQMMNAVNQEEFSVFIIPGSKTIQLANLQKIKNFYDQGGKVIATSMLPDRSAENGKDAEVTEIIKSMFGDDAYHSPELIRISASSTWNTGGFIPSYSVDNRPESYWKPAEGNWNAAWLEIRLGCNRAINRLKIKTPDEKSVTCLVGLYRGNHPVLEIDEGIVLNAVKGNGNETIVELADSTASIISIGVESKYASDFKISEVEVLDSENRNILSLLKSYTVHSNSRGGKAYFIPSPDRATLKKVLDDSGVDWDVRFEEEAPVLAGNLSYIHKRLDGRDIYFFANSSGDTIDIPVVLKGKHRLQIWNPQTGVISECPANHQIRKGVRFTKAQLKLGPVESVFWVSGMPDR